MKKLSENKNSTLFFISKLIPALIFLEVFLAILSFSFLVKKDLILTRFTLTIAAICLLLAYVFRYMLTSALNYLKT